ncbi:hypothetical protein GYA01_01645 [Patescibacteria group bacterium]|jgi:aminoglycoside phosphotransferase family enzyme|nr:hypothetical protein [Patescibacteria group bacterium]
MKAIEAIIGRIENIIETHMSLVYLGKEFVLKITKPVDLGFVDYRTLEKRIETARKTATIDLAYCPDLGSRVIEIDGEPAILMRRFDSSKGLDRLYDQEGVTIAHGYQIGQGFAKAHKRARTSKEISEVAYQCIAGNWEELFFVTKDIAQAIGRTITEEDYFEIQREIRLFIKGNDLSFQERRDNGSFKQCHGDGHAGNMFVEDDKVKVFDGIGFKDEFSYMDPVSDLAFPIMDAIVRSKREIADAIKESYLKNRPEETEAVQKLLSFYICYRAFVRGQVSTMIANTAEREAQEVLLKEARNYYNLAVEYLPRRKE